MPFPLAHPAAVLPLRRFCPRQFDFPALVIGSLTPDLGYCFGALHLGVFSHRLVTGVLAFCLPLGSLLVWLFYLARAPVAKHLPARYRQIIEPFCRRPGGLPLVIALSLLVGAWTHCLLDAVTHRGGWAARHLPLLEAQILAGHPLSRVCDLLYAACTLVGVAWLAWSFQTWLERAGAAAGWAFGGFKPAAALLLAALTTALSVVHQRGHPPLGIVPIGVLIATLLVAFVALTGLALRRPRRQPPGGTVSPAGCRVTGSPG